MIPVSLLITIPWLLERCIHYQTSVIINSDAHIAADVGNHQAAHALLTDMNFLEELVVNTSIEKLKKYIPVA